MNNTQVSLIDPGVELPRKGLFNRKGKEGMQTLFYRHPDGNRKFRRSKEYPLAIKNAAEERAKKAAEEALKNKKKKVKGADKK